MDVEGLVHSKDSKEGLLAFPNHDGLSLELGPRVVSCQGGESKAIGDAIC